jgi:hypothetical protein
VRIAAGAGEVRAHREQLLLQAEKRVKVRKYLCSSTQSKGLKTNTDVLHLLSVVLLQADSFP